MWPTRMLKIGLNFQREDHTLSGKAPQKGNRNCETQGKDHQKLSDSGCQNHKISMTANCDRVRITGSRKTSSPARDSVPM